MELNGESLSLVQTLSFECTCVSYSSGNEPASSTRSLASIPDPARLPPAHFLFSGLLIYFSTFLGRHLPIVSSQLPCSLLPFSFKWPESTFLFCPTSFSGCFPHLLASHLAYSLLDQVRPFLFCVGLFFPLCFLLTAF